MGSRAAVADDVQVHQRGVERGDIRIGQPQARHGLGAGIADEYVGRAGQAPERVASAFQIEVQHDAALAAVGVQEHGAHAAMPGRAQVADAVALGRLDLDHLGAHVPQDLGGHRARQRRRHVQHPYAAQRSVHSSAPLRLPEPVSAWVKSTYYLVF